MYACRVTSGAGCHRVGSRRPRHWWVSANQGERGPGLSPGRWSGAPPSSWHDRPRPWSDRLSGELLDDLQAWGMMLAKQMVLMPRRCKSAAARVSHPGFQAELGTRRLGVSNQMDRRMLRVYLHCGTYIRGLSRQT